MRFRAISDKEREENDKHPAKWFIGTPLSSIVTDSMSAEDLRWLNDWRQKVATFVESDEATLQAKVVREAYAVARREADKLQKMCDAVAGPEGQVLPSIRKQKEQEQQQGP